MSIVEEVDTVVTVGCIGSAGRKSDADKMSPTVYNNMYFVFERIVTHHLKLTKQQVDLVSGGAAFADHIAVRCFNEGVKNNNGYHSLHLDLPCEFNTTRNQFEDNGKSHWAQNPGQTSNYYHQKFSTKCKIQSLLQLSHCLTLPNVFATKGSNGFFNRNSLIAQKSTFLVAFTWSPESDSTIPKDGGTLDTWNKHVRLYPNATRIHIPLQLLELPLDDSKILEIDQFIEKQIRLKCVESKAEKVTSNTKHKRLKSKTSPQNDDPKLKRTKVSITDFF